MPEIRDITEPTEFIPEPTTPWWVWALVIAGAIILALTIIYIVRKREPERAHRTLLDQAREKLASLKKESSSLTPEIIATRTSVIIRTYLESAFDDPALFETNEEFTLRPTALEKLHPEARQNISDHLQQLSELKYEPHEDSDNANNRATALIDDASQVLAHIELNPCPKNRS